MKLKHDRQFTISVCKSRKDTNLKQKNTTFSEFCEQLRNPIRGTKTLSEFLKLPKSQQDDPEAKGGIVGAFCRKYDVFRAMDELIPGTYTPVDTADNRYTFVGGSTTGGAIIYDGGKFLYSHHATDPCSGKLVNAFDLVRLHKFGATDDTAAPGTPAGRMPSYTAMKQFAQTLPDVQIETATAAADFAGLESSTAEDDGWKQQLDISQAGGLKNSLNNIALILEHDSRFKGKLRKDIFNDRIEADSLPWDRPAGKPWDDTESPLSSVKSRRPLLASPMPSV